MEWVLSVPHWKDVDLLDNPWDSLHKLSGANYIAERLKDKLTFSRLYFGTEFCEKLIPKAEELFQVMRLARARRLNLTLVTPYVTELGLERLEDLFVLLNSFMPKSEVVVNDWGVLYYLRNKFPSLTPVLGRLLNKVWRDPRMLKYVKHSEQASAFSSCTLTGPEMKGLLQESRVHRVELDNVPQNIDPKISQCNYDLSLYIPFGYITTGRICFPGSWGLSKPEKFTTSNPCSQACRQYWLKMHDKGRNVPTIPEVEIYQKGNTVFYLQLGNLFEKGLQTAEDLGFNRIIYQPIPV